MAEYVVTRKSDGGEVYRYTSDTPVEWNGMAFASHDHTLLPAPGDAVAEPLDPARWKIYVGAFFDRFGAAKIGILADADPLVQAVIKDATVRTHIDLLGRRAELLQVVGLLNAKGHAVDPVAVLDLEPIDDEVWRG